MHVIRIMTRAFIVGCFVSSGCLAEETNKTETAISVKSLVLSGGEKTFTATDFNNDGFTDLVVAEDRADRIVVFLNDGAGGLGYIDDFPAGGKPTWVTALDFDSDGNTDIAIANHDAKYITLLNGKGDGTFKMAEQSPVPIETKPHSHMIDTADFNGDGYADIIIDSRDRLGVFILLGQKDGYFNHSGHGINVDGAPYLGFAIGDINNDGAPDIITPNRNDISVLLNRTSTGLAFEKVASIPFQSPFALAIGDMTGDGHLDIIATGEGANPSVRLFTGDGEGHFIQLMTFPIRAGAKTITMGDVNGDNLADAVVASWNSDAFLVIGASEEPTVIRLPLDGLQNPWGAVLGDFNGDGRDEIVIGDGKGERANIYTINKIE